jgi:replication fork clamp-binding protein CrfC
VTETIEILTDKVAGNSKGISDVPIVCQIYSATVPDLTMIDLPGITRNAVEGQPQNIEKLTKDLVRQYCENKDTLILCVIPANIDLSNSDALKLARKLDETGERTIGVLTKVDLMDQGTDCLKTLMNTEIPLKHGYVGIKGRSQASVVANMSV